jgi:hypothetical protein
MLRILVTYEAEIRRITVLGQLGKKKKKKIVHKIQSQWRKARCGAIHMSSQLRWTA